MLYRACLLALLLAFTAPAVAGAASQARMVDTFIEMGRDFWADRNVTICENPQAHITPLPEGVAGVQADGCHFWVSSTLVRQAARERWSARHGGDSNREELCTTVFHELGHTAGLVHTETGLMSELATETPGACRAWVARRERAERRAARDRARGITRTSG